MSSHELPSLPKTNMKSEGSGNITGLKFENRTRLQSHTRSPIQSSLLSYLVLEKGPLLQGFVKQLKMRWNQQELSRKTPAKIWHHKSVLCRIFCQNKKHTHLTQLRNQLLCILWSSFVCRKFCTSESLFAALSTALCYHSNQHLFGFCDNRW